MARLKRKSAALETARRRIAGLKQILPKPDFGSVMTEEAYQAEIDGYSTELDAYNGEVAALDDKTNRLDVREQRLADFNQRILAAVKMQFGPDSSEVELVGGVRRSDRKKPARTTEPPAKA